MSTKEILAKQTRNMEGIISLKTAKWRCLIRQGESKKAVTGNLIFTEEENDDEIPKFKEREI